MAKRKKINLGIIFGGKSGEHEVSLGSFTSVLKAIDKEKYNIIPIGINKNGNWLSGEKSYVLLNEEQRKTAHQLTSGFKKTNSGKSEIQLFEDKSHSKSIDVIFPILHGTYGEDGTVQGMLDLLNIPYIGSGVLGSALGMDKVVQKELYALHKLPQTKFYWFLYKNWRKNNKEILKKIIKKLQFPMFVKPANLGSSVGITKAKNKKQLIASIQIAGSYDTKILVEEGIDGIREIECSILGNDDPMASVLGEVIPSNEFYDYDAKYNDNKTRVAIPAHIPKDISKKIQGLAIDSFKILNLSGLSRIDFFLRKRDNAVFINEVNTLPGLTIMYPKLWEASGIPYKKLIDILVKLAIEKHKEKNRLKTAYKSIKSKKK